MRREEDAQAESEAVCRFKGFIGVLYMSTA
jgi:hypothetical protein